VSGQCPVCSCEQAENLLCHADTTRLERELGDVAAIVGELDITLSKQARIGVAGAPGLARERTPINVGAMNAADNLGNVLTTWARDVCSSPDCFSSRSGKRDSDLAAWDLLGHIDAIRRHPAVVELVDEISDAIHQARRVVDRPADRVYLGQCMVPTPDEEGRPITCLEDIYARPEVRETRCKVCGVTHEVAERRKALLDQAEDRLFTVQEAATLVGSYGELRITESTIRNYVSSGQISYHGKFKGKSVIRMGDLLAVIRHHAAKPTGRKLRRVG
jgi:hypothetical protein